MSDYIMRNSRSCQA